MRVLVTAMISALFATACADSLPRSNERFTPAPPPAAGYATLYMFRPYAGAGNWIWPIVFLNDVKVVDLKDVSYTYVYISPGKYHLHAKASSVVTNFNEDEKDFDFTIPSASGTYYLMFSAGGSMTLATGGAFVALPTGGAGWFMMPGGAAQPTLSKMFYQPPYVQTVGR
jgi:hypothetical protein